jgi:gas vesicle protein
MFGEYAALAKWLAIIAAVTTLIYTPYHIGRTLERNDCVLIEKDKQILADKTLKELNEKAMQKQEESTRLAQQLETQANDHQNEVNQLNSDLIYAKSHSVQRSGLCTNRSTVTASKDNHTGKIIETSANTAEISDFFKEFLISDYNRADTIGIYADEAYSLIIKLCEDKERFIC